MKKLKIKKPVFRRLSFKKGEMKKEEIQTRNRVIFSGIITGLILSSIYLFIKGNIWVSLSILIASPILFFLYYYYSNKLKDSARVEKMESIFPDFLQLMASNLRAGMTIDRSMLLSIRSEFAPLDEEIQKTGRDIATGKNMEIALLDMSKRIGSEKIKKTMMLIISGIRAGGNLATLLEQTSRNMKEKSFVEKRAASNVLMYVIFIFIAVSLAAPALFGLSSLLVETIAHLLSGLPKVDAANLPFTMSAVSVPVAFVKYFALVFILATDVMASMVLGLVSKGEERQGLKYLIPILIMSLVTFFAIRAVLSGVLEGLFMSAG